MKQAIWINNKYVGVIPCSFSQHYRCCWYMVKLLSSLETPTARVLTNCLFIMFPFLCSMRRHEFIVWMGHTALWSWNTATTQLSSKSWRACACPKKLSSTSLSGSVLRTSVSKKGQWLYWGFMTVCFCLPLGKSNAVLGESKRHALWQALGPDVSKLLSELWRASLFQLLLWEPSVGLTVSLWQL